MKKEAACSVCSSAGVKETYCHEAVPLFLPLSIPITMVSYFSLMERSSKLFLRASEWLIGQFISHLLYLAMTSAFCLLPLYCEGWRVHPKGDDLMALRSSPRAWLDFLLVLNACPYYPRIHFHMLSSFIIIYLTAQLSPACLNQGMESTLQVSRALLRHLFPLALQSQNLEIHNFKPCFFNLPVSDTLNPAWLCLL